MSETVVHVTTIEEWKAVLDVWFKQGYVWNSGSKEYSESTFKFGGEYLFLDNYITYSMSNTYSGPFIEYSEFMSQQKEDKEVKTYYVTQKQLDLINDLKKRNWPLSALVNSNTVFRPLNNGLEMIEEKAILSYLGGDNTIEFKVKEQLYRLWRKDDDGDIVYMRFSCGTPSYSYDKGLAFTAPLEEIKKHKTVSWEIEKAD